MERPFLRRRSPQAKPFAKAYLHPLSLLHNISNHSALMRSHSTTTSTLSSCNALLTVPMMSCWTPLLYHLHLANLPPLLSAPHHAVAECESNFFMFGHHWWQECIVQVTFVWTLNKHLGNHKAIIGSLIYVLALDIYFACCILPMYFLYSNVVMIRTLRVVRLVSPQYVLLSWPFSCVPLVPLLSAHCPQSPYLW